MKLLGGATSNRTPPLPGRVTGVGAVDLGALAVAGAGTVGAAAQVTGAAAVSLGGLGIAAAGAPIATQVTGAAAVQLGGLTTAAAGTVNPVDLWEDVTHNFPGTTLNTTLWNGTYGTAPTVHDNRLDWTALSGNYAGVQAYGGRSLIGSHVSIQLPVLNVGGFGGFAIKSDGGNVNIAELQVVSTGVRTSYAGSNWGDANDTTTNTSITPVAGCYLRMREQSGTLYTEYSADGQSWTQVDSYTLSASALAALADSRLELFCGPFPNAMTSGPAFANLNITP